MIIIHYCSLSIKSIEGMHICGERCVCAEKERGCVCVGEGGGGVGYNNYACWGK